MLGQEAFGNYVLIERIAIGGMAELFRAEHISGQTFATDICIKRILPHFSEDDAFIKMFIDEATIAAKLDHNGIVRIYDFDMVEESYYIAMELVSGRDLKLSLEACAKKQTRFTVPMTAHIMAEVCDALFYAHTKIVDGEPLNIIHRDVSPHNVLVSFDGEVKITDFGIAKAASRLTTTRAGTVKGKCAYMSPEQARGKTLDPRSDLFAVGIIMYEMLTGQRLFNGDSDFDILTKVLKEPIIPPGQVVTGIDPEIERICLKALERDRDVRYPDCAAMHRDLTNWLGVNGYNADNIGVGAFMRGLYGMDGGGALPQAPAAAINEDQAAIADMATAMFERPDFDAPPPAPAPASEINIAKTMPLESMDANAFESMDPDFKRRIQEQHRSSLAPEAPRMVVPAPGGGPARIAPDDATAMMDAISDEAIHAAETQGVALSSDQEAQIRAELAAQRRDTPIPAAPPQKKSKTGIIIAVLVLVGLFCFLGSAVGGYFLLQDPATLAALTGEKPNGEANNNNNNNNNNNSATDAETGSLMIKSTPEGGTIYINDELQDGKTPLLVKDLALNETLEIRVELDGHEIGRADKTLASSDEDTVELELDEKSDKDDGDEDEDDGDEDDGDEDKDEDEDEDDKDDAGDDDDKDDDAGDDDKDDDKDDNVADNTPPDKKALDGNVRKELTPEERDALRKRREEARKKREEAKGVGSVTINAYPFATVTLDGKKIGRTPIRSYKVSAGSHTIILKNPDFKAPYRKRIRVKKNEKKTVFHNFK